MLLCFLKHVVLFYDISPQRIRRSARINATAVVVEDSAGLPFRSLQEMEILPTKMVVFISPNHNGDTMGYITLYNQECVHICSYNVHIPHCITQTKWGYNGSEWDVNISYKTNKKMSWFHISLQCSVPGGQFFRSHAALAAKL